MINLIIQSILLLALPVIYAGVAASITWSHVEKPWLFFACTVVALYLIYGLAFYFAAPTVISMDLVVKTNHTLPPAPADISSEEFFPLKIYLRPIVIFSIAALPALWLIAKYFRR